MSRPKSPRCIVCDKILPKERVEALQYLELPITQWACVEHSVVAKKKGIFMGEVGTSELKIVDKVYDDSVGTVFHSTEKETTDNEVDEAHPEPLS